MRVTIVGTGYVGLVAGACFAETGNDVICVDINEARVAGLKKGIIPIYEPGLSDIVIRNTSKGRLHFTTSLKEGVESSQVIFIAVGTPQDEDGSADLTHVLGVAEGIGRFMNEPKVVVDKSTVPVGTAEKVKQAIEAVSKFKVDVVSNPEFLKEGAAIDDFLRPDRVVIGVESENAEAVMRELYTPFVRTNNPIIVMDVASAELTKYAANAMLALRISFMNEIANLCEAVGADVDKVRIGIGTDARIGMPFLFPGIGYGGSCFPKDVKALIRTAADKGVSMLMAEAAENANDYQKSVIIQKINKRFPEGISGKHFAVWGLAFKPKTDDVREAPALTVCRELLAGGAFIQAYDPEAMGTFEQALTPHQNIVFTNTNYDALKGTDALVICTEWNEFRNPSFDRVRTLMNKPIIFDGRNILSRTEMKRLSFEYYPIGRTAVA
jgi:UDPglucose 6-dehydrogenase